MQSGYNNEIRFRGHLFHVQTEDSGAENPFVRTHLFLQGSIVATIQETYIALLSVTELGKLVRKMMQEQHKLVIRQLMSGAYDEQVQRILTALAPPAAEQTAVAAETPVKKMSQPIVQDESTTYHKVIDLGDGEEGEMSLDEMILRDLKEKKTQDPK